MFKAKKWFGFLPTLIIASIFLTLITSQAAELSRQPIKEGQVVANVANLTSPDAPAITTGSPDALNASIVASGVFSTTEVKLLSTDGAEYDYFGRSVSINGDVALVGALLDNDNGSFSGSAYTFFYSRQIIYTLDL